MNHYEILKNVSALELMENSFFIRKIVELNLFINNNKFKFEDLDIEIIIFIIWTLVLKVLIDSYIFKKRN
jgi:hypothetical protein